jgi:hypothetical protein
VVPSYTLREPPGLPYIVILDGDELNGKWEAAGSERTRLFSLSAILASYLHFAIHRQTLPPTGQEPFLEKVPGRRRHK